MQPPSPNNNSEVDIRSISVLAYDFNLPCDINLKKNKTDTLKMTNATSQGGTAGFKFKSFMHSDDKEASTEKESSASGNNKASTEEESSDSSSSESEAATDSETGAHVTDGAKVS